jgi:hypothetical protein
MRWTKTEIRGTMATALVDRDVLMGYVVEDTSRPNSTRWLLYRGDHELFFQVFTLGEAMRVLEEISKFGRCSA